MRKGIVLKSTGSLYLVKLENGQTLNCAIKGKFRKNKIKSTNPVAVGDYVEIEYFENEETGIIREILDRKNYILRKSSNLSKTSHIIAANVDQVLLIITLINPKTTTLFIDRFLVSAEAYRIPVILIFNKTDLYQNEQFIELEKLKKEYALAGYKQLETSIISKINLDQIKNIMQNKISVFGGNSGVGKSALINCIDEKINLKIGEISHYHKSGKHTTTFAEMLELSFGGYVIDTPGIKGFGLIDVQKDELYHFFPEIFKYSKKCKFYNCFHINEPGCFVKESVNKGLIGHSRYQNYLNIYFADEGKYR